MKSIKLALLAGAAVAVSAAAAQADDLEALKAQIETLNARVAAMETAPSVPAGYSLLAISEGERVNTPGLEWKARDAAAYGNEATIISVLPTADAPAGTTITWSGFARAGLVYANSHREVDGKLYTREDANDEWDKEANFSANNDDEDNGTIDVKARGQLRVTAATDTAVGEVGVDIRMRANFNGNGAGDVYSDVAWGYWAMTPEVTFGGGYAGSLGNIGYGLDGSCTCQYTDNADAGILDPGDTTQMRVSYGSGPFSMAIALEDASIRGGGDDFGANDSYNGDRLGAAGEIKYSGDTISGEISAVWRDVKDYDDTITLGGQKSYELETDLDALWQVGAGVGFALGDMANLSLAAAMGGGPAIETYEGEIIEGIPYNETWWGVTGLASVNLSDEIHAEIGAGYKSRSGDSFDYDDENDINTSWSSDGADYSTWTVLGGLYYDPVDQLTIGIEAEYYTTDTSITVYGDSDDDGESDTKVNLDSTTENLTVDLVSVWRF